MRHAGEQTLAALEPLLAELRRIRGLAERRRGTFYRGSRAFLHFHEDPAGPFADLKCGATWERRRVTTQTERRALLRRAKQLAGG
jgi:hypothetical protein